MNGELMHTPCPASAALLLYFTQTLPLQDMRQGLHPGECPQGSRTHSVGPLLPLSLQHTGSWALHVLMLSVWRSAPESVPTPAMLLGATRPSAIHLRLLATAERTLVRLL